MMILETVSQGLFIAMLDPASDLEAIETTRESLSQDLSLYPRRRNNLHVRAYNAICLRISFLLQD